jgi:hypothetical protein
MCADATIGSVLVSRLTEPVVLGFPEKSGATQSTLCGFTRVRHEWNMDTTPFIIFDYKAVTNVEAGESEYVGVLKTHNLLIFRDAKNAEHGKIAPNWNVSGTRGFRFCCHPLFF